MKVILRKNIEGLGKSGDVISAKDGFARNFLIPKGFALAATQGNINKIELEKKKSEHEKITEKAKVQKLVDKLQGFSCTIAVEAQEENLYGSVSAADICEALLEEEMQIEEKDILLDSPIDKLGIYEVGIRLHPELTTKIKIWVVKK
jgi:large subunit ribosomal protein L9